MANVHFEASNTHNVGNIPPSAADNKKRAALITSLVGSVIIAVGILLILAVYQILPHGVNAMSQLGMTGNIIAFGTTAIGVMALLFGTIWNKSQKDPKKQLPLPEPKPNNQKPTLPLQSKMTPQKFEGLPGSWYVLETSQVKEGGPNACASVALVTMNYLMSCQLRFIPEDFHTYIQDAVGLHKGKYGTNPANRFPKEIIHDLGLEFLNQSCEITYDPSMAGLLDGAPQRREDLSTHMIAAAQGGPFVSTLCEGFETIAILYKSPKEIYVLDSHQKDFTLPDGRLKHLDQAYVVKFESKEALDDFLFKFRYPENDWAQQMDALVFPL